MIQTYQLVSEVKENDSRACEEHFNIGYGWISEFLEFWTNFLKLIENRRNLKIGFGLKTGLIKRSKQKTADLEII